MIVYKFGGASVVSPERIKIVGEIIKNCASSPLIVVLSAMGKMTNSLEDCLHLYYAKEDCTKLFSGIRNTHLQMGSKILSEPEKALPAIHDVFVEGEWLLEEDPHPNFDYSYDQLVSIGELASTKILYYYLKEIGVKVHWLDARDVLKTDNRFRDAQVHLEETQALIKSRINDLSKDFDVILTQGFIGSTSENFTTTLGREGSDYSAAIFSYCLDVESLTIWKDVTGVLTADPTRFENVQLLEKMSYTEAIEMTYYGAKVIHPKTIKPLQNKQIPLMVRSFLDLERSGTVITSEGESYYPPIVVIEPDQTLIHISTRDFSFVAEAHLSDIFRHVNDCHLKVNLMRNSAISFTICVNTIREKIDKLIALLKDQFEVKIDSGMELITIRHFNESMIHSLTEEKVLVYEERHKNTAQIVVKKIDPLKPKS